MVRHTTNFLLHPFQFLVDHFHQFPVVINHDVVDFPLSLGEDVLNHLPCLGLIAIHTDRIKFPLQLEAFRDYTSPMMVIEVL